MPKSTCRVPDCNSSVAFKGLCMTCYRQAKKMVESGKTTWDGLAELGLAAAPETKFGKAFRERTDQYRPGFHEGEG